MKIIRSIAPAREEIVVGLSLCSRVCDNMKRDKHTLVIYNKYDFHQATAFLSGCVVCYTYSLVRAFIDIYHNHWWFAFLGDC